MIKLITLLALLSSTKLFAIDAGFKVGGFSGGGFSLSLSLDLDGTEIEVGYEDKSKDTIYSYYSKYTAYYYLITQKYSLITSKKWGINLNGGMGHKTSQINHLLNGREFHVGSNSTANLVYGTEIFIIDRAAARFSLTIRSNRIIGIFNESYNKDIAEGTHNELVDWALYDGSSIQFLLGVGQRF